MNVEHRRVTDAQITGLSRTAYSSLAGTELVKLLAAPVTDSATSPKDELIKEQTRRLRRNVEMAIEQGHACKNFVRIKEQNKSKFLCGVRSPHPCSHVADSDSFAAVCRRKARRMASSATPSCTSRRSSARRAKSRTSPPCELLALASALLLHRASSRSPSLSPTALDDRIASDCLECLGNCVPLCSSAVPYLACSS